MRALRAVGFDKNFTLGLLHFWDLRDSRRPVRVSLDCCSTPTVDRALWVKVIVRCFHKVLITLGNVVEEFISHQSLSGIGCSVDKIVSPSHLAAPVFLQVLLFLCSFPTLYPLGSHLRPSILYFMIRLGFAH